MRKWKNGIRGGVKKYGQLLQNACKDSIKKQEIHDEYSVVLVEDAAVLALPESE